jgi:7-cyano-7-deazaguanine synthase
MQERSTESAKKSSKALVLFSSGLDSTYNLLKAKKSFKKVTALFFDYGQKSAAQERACEKLDVEFIKIDLLWYKNLGSTLLTHGLKPTTFDSLKDISEKEKPAEWVPNRNGVFVNIAAAIAEAKGYQSIVIGVNLEEAGRYPDNTVEFVNRANGLFEYSTLSKPSLISFTSDMTKTDIIKELLGLMEEYGFGKEYIWSCYDSYERMCGRCESCLRLKSALKAHGRDGEWKELFLR